MRVKNIIRKFYLTLFVCTSLCAFELKSVTVVSVPNETVQKMLEGINVKKMPYCKNFDCDDFAFQFDAQCKLRNINSWTLEFGAYQGIFHQKDIGHLLNIIEIPKEGPRHEFCIVEPQGSNGPDEIYPVVACWDQSSDWPILSEEVKTTLFYFAYPKFGALISNEGYSQRTYIFEDGHSTQNYPTFGKEGPPFNGSEDTMREYKESTGHDPIK